MFLNQRALKKALRVKIPMFRNIIKPLIASAIMAGIIFILKEPASMLITITNGGIMLKGITTLLIIVIGGFVYLYLMMVLGGIKKSDMDSISPRIFTLLPRFLRVKLK